MDRVSCLRLLRYIPNYTVNRSESVYIATDEYDGMIYRQTGPQYRSLIYATTYFYIKEIFDQYQNNDELREATRKVDTIDEHFRNNTIFDEFNIAYNNQINAFEQFKDAFKLAMIIAHSSISTELDNKVSILFVTRTHQILKESVSVYKAKSDQYFTMLAHRIDAIYEEKVCFDKLCAQHEV
jgi:hypothetical protein